MGCNLGPTLIFDPERLVSTKSVAVLWFAFVLIGRTACAQSQPANAEHGKQGNSAAIAQEGAGTPAETVQQRADALLKAAVSAIQAGEYDQAIREASEAIRLIPNYPRAYGIRGDSYSRRGEYDLAISDFDEAVRLEPDYALASRREHKRMKARGSTTGR